MRWQTSKRTFTFERLLVMGILNVTPDSFSDGGQFVSVDAALNHAERLIFDGADIIDVGGESTRPGSGRVSVKDEIARVVPVIEAIAKRFETAISIDTTRAEVARMAVDAGAEIINDISGLRFEPNIADVAASTGAGLILMYSRGSFETMHSEPPVNDIFADVRNDFTRSVNAARERGVADVQIVLDVGFGFGKTQDQNLDLLAKLDNIVAEFKTYPMMVGTSRKSFVGKAFGGATPRERLDGSLVTALTAMKKGAAIVRVHDVKETIAAINSATERV